MRGRTFGLAAAVAIAGGVLGACGESPAAPAGAPSPNGFSFLALGDTGRPPHPVDFSSGQMAVARGLEAVDRSRPVDALVLLGDNFYYSGLIETELLERLRANLVHPYCRFLALTGPRAREVEDACALPTSERRPVPVLAVLGNHDIKSPDSARLESEVIPEFVANWRLPSALVETVELAPGLSLILFDSNRVIEQRDPAPLADAIRGAQGPWRVLAAHHPIGTSKDKGYTPARGFGDYGALIRRAVADAGVPVALMLAGHEHNLQVLSFPPPGPALEIVSGGGSSPVPVVSSSAARRFGLETLGFARLDFPERPEGRAVVTLFATSKLGALLGRPPQRVAQWSVDLAGSVRDESPPVR
jgi:Calcineurin-like phosphoesterase